MKKQLLTLVALLVPTLVFAGNGQMEDDSSCSRVITGYTYTNAAQPKFHGTSGIAVVTEINGSPIVRGKKRFIIPVGKNTLKVGHILNDNPKKENKFVLTTKANTTYYISYVQGAEWQDNKSGNLEKKQYSGPIVVKEKTQNCRK